MSIDNILDEILNFNNILESNALFYYTLKDNIQENFIRYYNYKNYIRFVNNYIINKNFDTNFISILNEQYNQLYEKISKIDNPSFDITYNFLITSLNFAYIIYEYYNFMFILYHKININSDTYKNIETIKKTNNDIIITNIENSYVEGSDSINFTTSEIIYNDHKENIKNIENSINKNYISKSSPINNENDYITILINVYNIYLINTLYKKIINDTSTNFKQQFVDENNEFDITLNKYRMLKYFLIYNFFKTYFNNNNGRETFNYFNIINYYYYDYVFIQKNLKKNNEFLTFKVQNKEDYIKTPMEYIMNSTFKIFNIIRKLKCKRKINYITLAQTANNCWFISFLTGLCYSDMSKKLLLDSRIIPNSETKRINKNDNNVEYFKNIIHYIISNITKKHKKYNVKDFVKTINKILYINKNIEGFLNKLAENDIAEKVVKTKNFSQVEMRSLTYISNTILNNNLGGGDPVSTFIIYKYLLNSININTIIIYNDEGKFYTDDLNKFLSDDIKIIMIVNNNVLDSTIGNFRRIFNIRVDIQVFENFVVRLRDKNYNEDFCILNDKQQLEEDNKNIKIKSDDKANHVICGFTYNKTQYIHNSQTDYIRRFRYSTKNKTDNFHLGCSIIQMDYKKDHYFTFSLYGCSDNSEYSHLNYLSNNKGYNNYYAKACIFYVLEDYKKDKSNSAEEKTDDKINSYFIEDISNISLSRTTPKSSIKETSEVVIKEKSHSNTDSETSEKISLSSAHKTRELQNKRERSKTNSNSSDKIENKKTKNK